MSPDTTGAERRRSDEPSSSLLAALVDASPDILVALDRTGHLRYASPAFERLLGWSVRSVATFFEVIHPEDVGTLSIEFTDALAEADGVAGGTDFRVAHADGGWRWLEVVAANRVDDPEIDGLVVSARDVTDRVNAEQVRQASDQRYRTLVERSPDLVLRFDAERRLVFQNPAAEAILGPIGSSDPTRLGVTRVDQATVTHFGEELADVLATGTPRTFEVAMAVAGVHRWYEVLLVPEPASGSDGAHVLAIGRDTTDRKRLELDLTHRALHDPLTGLANRSRLEAECQRLLDRRADGAGSVAVLFVDLDTFKSVNDTYGHAAGDALLVAVAARLRRAVRPADLLARFGGDEFVLLLDHVSDTGEAVAVAERLHRSLAEPIPFGEHRIALSASIGVAVAVATDAGTTSAALLRRADAAMYRSKRRGWGQTTVYDAETAADTATRDAAAAALEVALGGPSIEVWFQPVVTLADGVPTGVEALVRWPTRPPVVGDVEAIVQLAEETGLASRLDTRVIAEALTHLAAWPAGPAGPIGLRLNVSPSTIAREDWLDALLGQLAGRAIPTTLVTLELRETPLLDRLASLGVRLQAVREAGVRVAVDQFGTGFASVAQLKRLPVDELKISRLFVAGLGQDRGDEAVVAAVRGLADAFGLGITAQGVETEAQRDALLRLGVSTGQGHLFAAPVPAHGIPPLLSTRLGPLS
ncbi:MAG: EAL domain-containing protein [Acidimicrobiales bacterium]|nr:EAL domain-containing protein [Acidimicrobiales bacterium]